MKKAIIAIGIVALFIGMGSIANVSGKTTNEDLVCLGNSPPEMWASQAIYKVVWNRRGMTAPFSAKATDPDNDECRLCVKISDSQNGVRNKQSSFSEDYRKKYVSFDLDPKDYPIGLTVDWDMWIEDTNGAESNHWTGEFTVRRSNARSYTIPSLMLEKFPVLLHLLQRLGIQ